MATWPLRPTPQDLNRIEQEVAAIPALQQELLDRDPALKMRDRVAHQYQIAGGKIVLTIAPTLPANLSASSAISRIPVAATPSRRKTRAAARRMSRRRASFLRCTRSERIASFELRFES